MAPDRPKPKIELAKQLDRMESKLNELAILMATLKSNQKVTVQAGSPFIVGWNNISKFVGKRSRTLRRYQQKAGLPVFRWGRHVITSPHLLNGWLLSRGYAKSLECSKIGLAEQLLKLRGWM